MLIISVFIRMLSMLFALFVDTLSFSIRYMLGTFIEKFNFFSFIYLFIYFDIVIFIYMVPII